MSYDKINNVDIENQNVDKEETSIDIRTITTVLKSRKRLSMTTANSSPSADNLASKLKLSPNQRNRKLSKLAHFGLKPISENEEIRDVGKYGFYV